MAKTGLLLNIGAEWFRCTLWCKDAKARKRKITFNSPREQASSKLVQISA
jgi:hypothetical protein